MTYEEALYLLTDWFHSYKDHNGVQVHERHITPEYREAEEKIRELIHTRSTETNEEIPTIELKGLKPTIKTSYRSIDVESIHVMHAMAKLREIETFKKSRLFRLTEKNHIVPTFDTKRELKEYLSACYDRLCFLEDIVFDDTKERSNEQR